MRNDARPVGDRDPIESEHTDAGDARDTVSHDRQSHIVNEGAAENARRDDADIDPTMPTGDSTLNTKI